MTRSPLLYVGQLNLMPAFMLAGNTSTPADIGRRLCSRCKGVSCGGE
jgi:hypothetical protein